jgi:hypothetical protein
MDYDPNEDYSYWRDEFPLDVALGLLFGVVLFVLILGVQGVHRV